MILSDMINCVSQEHGETTMGFMIGSMVPVLCAKRGTLVATPFGILEGLGFRMLVAGVVYIPHDTLRLLRFGAQASDVWIATPEKKEEACGGGHGRAALNGVPSIATATGGMRENIMDTIRCFRSLRTGVSNCYNEVLT